MIYYFAEIRKNSFFYRLYPFRTAYKLKMPLTTSGLCMLFKYNILILNRVLPKYTIPARFN